MLKKYYSATDPSKLLHMVCRTSLVSMNRTDVVEEDEFLQLAILKMEQGKTFAPHKHIFKEVPPEAIAQESWVVMRGRVKVIFYDLNDKIMATDELGPGDLSITLAGGHNYEILEEDTLVLEYKTGPYYGQKLDKVFIDDQD